MKKILSIMLTAVLLSGLLTGCAKEEPKTEEPAAEAPADEGAEKEEAAAAEGAPADYGTIPANISIGASPSGQAAYTMCAGIADVINKAGIGTTVTVEETNGYPVNVQLMMNEEIEFGFVNNMMQEQVYAASGPYADFEPGQVLSVMSLGATEMHVIVAADSDIQSIYDFAGKRVGVGQPGGIVLDVTTMFLDALGYGEDDFERLDINLQNQCDYLQDGQLDVILWIGNAPLAAVSGLVATKDIRLLEIDEEAIARMQEKCSAVESCVIPAGAYAGQEEEVKSFCLRNMLAVRADVSDETVYQFTKLIMENVEALSAVHASMANISPETVVLGLNENTPLHPGALRYYEEIGVEGLENLK